MIPSDAILAAMNDVTGRRGIWYRQTDEGIEIWGGREGDDHYLKIEANKNLSSENLEELASILGTGALMIDENPPEEWLWILPFIQKIRWRTRFWHKIEPSAIRLWSLFQYKHFKSDFRDLYKSRATIKDLLTRWKNA